MFIVLRFGFALFVLFGFGAHKLSEYADHRFSVVEQRVEAQCRAFRKTPGHESVSVCADDRFGRQIVPDYKVAQAHLEDARKFLSSGDRAAARAHVEAALVVAREVDDRRTMIGSLLVGTIVNDALDLAEAHPADLDPKSLARDTHLWSADHPMEVMRLNRLFQLSQGVEHMPGPAPLVKLFTAEWIDREDAKLSEMQRALLADDLKRCERAADAAWDAMLCTKMAAVVRGGRRLRALRDRGVPR